MKKRLLLVFAAMTAGQVMLIYAILWGFFIFMLFSGFAHDDPNANTAGLDKTTDSMGMFFIFIKEYWLFPLNLLQVVNNPTSMPGMTLNSMLWAVPGTFVYSIFYKRKKRRLARSCI